MKFLHQLSRMFRSKTPNTADTADQLQLQLEDGLRATLGTALAGYLPEPGRPATEKQIVTWLDWNGPEPQMGRPTPRTASRTTEAPRIWGPYCLPSACGAWRS